VAQHAKWPSAKPGSENITKKKKEIKIGKRAKLLERIQEWECWPNESESPYTNAQLKAAISIDLPNLSERWTQVTVGGKLHWKKYPNLLVYVPLSTLGFSIICIYFLSNKIWFFKLLMTSIYLFIWVIKIGIRADLVN